MENNYQSLGENEAFNEEPTALNKPQKLTEDNYDAIDDIDFEPLEDISDAILDDYSEAETAEPRLAAPTAESEPAIVQSAPPSVDTDTKVSSAARLAAALAAPSKSSFASDREPTAVDEPKIVDEEKEIAAPNDNSAVRAFTNALPPAPMMPLPLPVKSNQPKPLSTADLAQVQTKPESRFATSKLPNLSDEEASAKNAATESAPAPAIKNSAKAMELLTRELPKELLAKAAEAEAAEAAKTKAAESKAPTKKTAASQPATEPEGGEDDVKSTLAEMSIYEGDDALARGDRLAAITHYREALNYVPKNAHVHMKLADLLSEEMSTMAEAEQLLSRAIELEPNDLNALSRLAELREKKKRDASSPKREAQSPSAGANQKKTGNTGMLTPPAKTGNTGMLSTPAMSTGNTGALTAGAINNPTTDLGTAKRGKGKKGKGRIVASMEEINLRKGIGPLNWLVLFAIVGLLVSSLYYSLSGKQVKVNVKLVSPPDEANVRIDGLELNWQANAASFVIQVEENGNKLFQRVTPETRYLLDASDTKLLKPGHRYTWRVLPFSASREPLPYETDDFQFKVLPPNSSVVNATQQAVQATRSEASQRNVKTPANAKPQASK